MIREEWDFDRGFSQTFGYEYEPIPELPVFYTSSNVFLPHQDELPIQENYDYSGQGGGPSYFEYDTYGKLILKTFVRLDGMKTETTFDFDEEGILLKSHRKYINGLTGEFTYRFNGNRKLTERLFLRSDGVKGSEKYVYNNRMELIEAEYINFDTWLTGTIMFENDDQGRPVSGNYTGTPLNARLTFEYDNSKNPTRIHWEFEDGKTQTYFFTY